MIGSQVPFEMASNDDGGKRRDGRRWAPPRSAGDDDKGKKEKIGEKEKSGEKEKTGEKGKRTRNGSSDDAVAVGGPR